MVTPSDARPAEGLVSIDQAARRLGIPPGQMLALKMVILLPDGQGMRRIPEWCAEPSIASVMPILSDHFTGEALAFCLVHMRPKGDGRNGVDLLRSGEWRIVRDTLRLYRRRFDQIMELFETDDRLTLPDGGAGMAAPYRV